MAHALQWTGRPGGIPSAGLTNLAMSGALTTHSYAFLLECRLTPADGITLTKRSAAPLKRVTAFCFWPHIDVFPLLLESIFEKRDWPVNSQHVYYFRDRWGWGGVAFLSLKKEANSAEPATFWEEWESLYIVSSLATAALGSQWSRAETMVAYWGSNTATQEILIIAAPPALFPHQLLLGNRWARPQTFWGVCVVFLVGRGADQGVQGGTLGLFY